MVWDQHAQKVVLAVAKMLTVVPVIREIVVAAFDGTTAMPAGFFFMNLFMHVELPLGMIIFLWAFKSNLVSKKKYMIWSAVGLTTLSVIFPAPLLGKVDLLLMLGNMPMDIVFGFWISWVDSIGVVATLCILLAVTAFLLSIPWLWKLKEKQVRKISEVDLHSCTGCMQCTRDCPYEAIKMEPRVDGKRLIAKIIPQHCVSCGICSASCANFAKGPEGRTALDQKERVKAFCQDLKNSNQKLQIVMIVCANNMGFNELVA